MKIRKHLRIILLGACLIHSLAMAADTQPANTNAVNLPNTEISVASKDDLSAQKELFQLQLDAKKELLQKDIEAQAKLIDAFEKRIDDQTNRIGDIGSSVDMFGVIAGILGALITVVLVGIGIWGYKAAKSDAKVTAEQVASKWFEENHKNLNSRMEELESRFSEASKTIHDLQDNVAQISSAASAEIEATTVALKEKAKIEIEFFQSQLRQSFTGEKSENPPPQENAAIEQKAEQLKQKPETEYTFTDWNTRAFAAYSEGKLDDAIFYWDKAIASVDIQPQDQAQTMLNKGFALGRLNRGKEEIETYNAVIEKFGNAEELSLREQVANAMVNKAVTLGQLHGSEEAIAACDEVIIKFGTAEELSLRVRVASAMANKGNALSRLSRNEDAIAVYDAVITQFSTAEELSFRVPVANALNGKGFSLLCIAKAHWGNVAFAKELLVNANNACTLAISKNSDLGTAHGNLAYITWLQNDAIAAERHFRIGLSSTTDSGESLYKVTLTDFDIHPIEPDQGFRELVEKLWAEYRQSNKS
jgi:tetratricopeptide (TPR) repeat protein